jgi:uncharacterized protein YbjT (DUF2867 family)
MSRLIILGATGSLGSHVLRLALAAGHQVTVFVRTPSRLPPEARTQISLHQGDLATLAPRDIAQLISEQDSLINCAGRVTDGQTFVDLIDLPADSQLREAAIACSCHLLRPFVAELSE